MSAPEPRLALGTTIEFLESEVEIQVTSSDWGGISRTVHKTPHLGTPEEAQDEVGNVPKLLGKLRDAGSLKIEGHFSGPALSLIKANMERVRITLPLEDGQTTPDIFEITAGASNMKPPKLDPDGILVISFDLEISGGLQYTPAT